MRPPALIYATLVLLVFILSSPCRAEEPSAEGKTVIIADVIEQRGNVLHATGSVVVEGEGMTMRAESVLYDTSSGEVVAEGGVSFEDPKARITASKAALNIEAETGVLYDAEVLFKEGDYRITGTRIEKTGYNTYVLDEGSLTTCPGPVPDWCVRGRDVDLAVGDRIKSRNSTFRVRDVPVLFTPYFWAPVVTERKTGLLIPKVGYSSDKGFSWMQPFFWAISENRDATLIVDAYARRGVGLGAEYRYVEAPGVEGSAYFYHIRDAELHRDFNELRAEHRHSAGAFRGFYDVKYVSAKDFYREYEPYLVESSRRFLESQAEASVRSGPVKLFADARYLRELKDGEDQKAVAQKLPEAGVFVNPLPLGPVVLTAEARAANFERGTGPDGQRFDARLAIRNSIGTGLTFSQGLALGLSYYDITGAAPGADPTFDRGSVSYSAELRTSLARAYGEVEHIVQPALSYDFTRLERETPPLFDSEEAAEDVSEAALTLTNRFRDAGGEFLTVRLREAYDFLPDDDNFKPLKLDLRLERPLSLALGLDYDWHDRRVVKSSSSLRYESEGLRVKAGHTYSAGDITMYNLGLAYDVTPSTTLKSGAWYDATNGDLERLNLGLIYKSECWALGVDYTRRPDEHIVFVTLTLKGLGDIEI